MATMTALQLDVLDHHRTFRPVATTLLEESKLTSFDLIRPSTTAQDRAITSTTVPKGRSLIVIIQLAGINFITSFSNGLITVGLPAMAVNLGIQHTLLVWPTAAFALTSGSLLLLAGSFADVIGPKPINVTGCFLVALFTLLSGISRTGMELIMFRALQGMASALTFPSSISIISQAIEPGKRRNIGFACLGLAMPLGFSFGLVLGGVLVSGIGWRAGFYIAGGVGFLLFFVGIWSLPASAKPAQHRSIWKRLRTEIDWLGVGLSSSCLAIFSYVLAALSANINSIKKPTNIVLLAISALLAPSFMYWMHVQEKAGRPALIPNSLWKRKAFTSICLMVLLSTAVVNCMELFSSLFFQEVQGLSALQASLRILPNMILGIVTNFLTGYLIDKFPAIYAVLISSVFCAGGPLLMALINPSWPYWYDAFFAQLLSPLSVDILFTVGILIVSEVFPENTQALAGAVFNTLAQLGTSIGLTTMSVIADTVTDESRFKNKSSPSALMEGYRATFFALFAWMVAACVIGGYGLKSLGKIGQKRD